jgi:hypothetical protein
MPPPPQPVPFSIALKTTISTTVGKALENARRFGRGLEWRLSVNPSKRARRKPSVRLGAARGIENGLARGKLEMAKPPLVPPLVATETMNGAGLPFEICTVAGPWMVAPSGAPLYARETVPLYPAPGAIWRLNCAV